MFYVENTKLGFTEPVYFIADIAANHDGDIERAKDLIFLASESGANAAKFQHFDAKTIVSKYGFQNLKTGLSHQEKWKKSVFSMYEDATVDLEWTNILKKTCEKAGISFFTTPYSLDLVDYIDDYVTAYKIFLDNKVFGVGVKNFRNFCSDEKYEVSSLSCSTHPHNIYI